MRKSLLFITRAVLTVVLIVEKINIEMYIFNKYKHILSINKSLQYNKNIEKPISIVYVYIL